MGKRGPRPSPTTLRVLRGERNDRINTDEPIPAEGAVEPPPNLAPAVREVWDYTVRQLSVMGTATPADRDALVCYCEAVVNHRAASALLAKTNILTQNASRKGGLAANPALLVQRQSAQLVRQFAAEFGLTPSARSEINASAARRVDGGAERLLS